MPSILDGLTPIRMGPGTHRWIERKTKKKEKTFKKNYKMVKNIYILWPTIEGVRMIRWALNFVHKWGSL